MNNKLTAIKIKYPSGQYSNPIYISVEAKNVRYNSVQNIVDIVDSLSARISAIASIPEGGTTSDAQLIDGRIGFDYDENDTSTHYSSIGDAIRANDEKNTQLILVKDIQPTETWNKLWLDTSETEEQKIISVNDMANIIAVYYDENTDYAVGDYVIHEDVATGIGKLYKCKTAISNGEQWTAAHWDETNIIEDYNQKFQNLQDIIDSINEPFNLYDPTAEYRQTNFSNESRNGYTINNDGSITCVRSNGGYGSLFLVDDNRQLLPGTYVISGKMTLTISSPTGTSVRIGVGRAGATKEVSMTTERGGEIEITTGSKIGWFSAVMTVTAEESFAFMVIPQASNMVSSNSPCIIENLMITKGSQLFDYYSDNYSANDKISRNWGQKINNRIDKISERFNFYDPSVKYTQTNASGTSKTGYTIFLDGSIGCTRSLGNYGRLYLVDQNTMLEIGTYTISGKVTLTIQDPTSTTMSVAVGRQSGAYSANITSTRGGETTISSGDTVGWFFATINIETEEPLAIMAMPSASNMVNSSYPCLIENLTVTKTDFLMDLVSSDFTSIDYVARSQINSAGYLKAKDIFNGEPFIGLYDYNTPVTNYGALFQGTRKVESFAFFTDPHVMGFSDADRNTDKMNNYFKRVQKTINSTPCLFTVCGGDLLNNATTINEACYRLGLLKGILTHQLDKCYLVLGNHDTNYQGKNTSEDSNGTGRLSNDTIASILYRDTNTKKSYYSFDGANSKCYVLDTGIEHSTMSELDWAQVEWLGEQLLSDDPQHAIIFLHIILSVGEFQLNTSNFATLVQAYNAHSTIELNSISYDFTSCTGHVDLWIGGHTHRDSTGTLGGIPYIITGSNSYTSDIPLIDLVLVDYDNNVAKTIRVGGTGENRTVNLI